PYGEGARATEMVRHGARPSAASRSCHLGAVVLLASLRLKTRRGAVAVLLASAAAFLSSCSGSPELSSPRPARNVILFIGDGMGVSIYTSTRIWKVGATGKLAIDTLPHTALCSTYSFDNIVTDSAPSATAMLSGAKARNGVIGEDCDAESGT